MTTFIRSPFWENWFMHNPVDRSLVICSPYFKKNALDKIIDQFELDDDECILDVKILIRGTLDDFLQGSSDLTALDALLGLRCIDVDNVRRITNLHMKAYLRDGEDLLIGSGNCTGPGLSFGGRIGNVEGGIQTYDENVIDDFYDYFEDIFDHAEPLSMFYDSISDQYTEETLAPFRSRPTVVNRNASGERRARYDFRRRRQDEVMPEQVLEMSVQDIPQFSSFDHAVYDTPFLVDEANRRDEFLTFDRLGELLPGERTDTLVAKKKYGENHAKTAELLGLITILPEQTRKLQITPLGQVFLDATPEEKDRILTRQIMRTAIVRDIYSKYELTGSFDITQYLENYLSHSTAVRRRPNVKVLFEKLADFDVEGAEEILENVF